ncbi:MAG: hypothetical protein VXA34_00900 [Gammaproteobacteria bacterium]
MGPDKLQYDSTGAGEMVKSHDSEVMGGFAAPGGGSSLPGNASGGPVPVDGHHDGSDVRTIEGAAGGPIGGFAKPGGAQDI